MVTIQSDGSLSLNALPLNAPPQPIMAGRPSEYTIHTSKLFNPKSKEVLANVSVTVDTVSGLIVKVFERETPLQENIQEPDIDLRGKFVIPGLVDAHTHIFLHAYDENSSTSQIRDESFVERVIRATNHCRAALLAGYTTYRDLGTEGLQTADTNVRDAINRGITPGPRLFVATNPITSTGTYDSRTENHLGGTRLPTLSDAADGVSEIRKAVRRRIGFGADVIKVYADYRRRQMRFPPMCGPVCFAPEDPNPQLVAYSLEELRGLVEEAERADCAVAAHAGSAKAVRLAAQAGVTSIEHGYLCDDETLRIVRDHGCIFVPTLAMCEHDLPSDSKKFEEVKTTTRRAWHLGVSLACGGDTGTFPHGENAREMELMVDAGVPVLDVLVASTLGGWQACGGDRCGRRFGWFEKGVAADIVALDSDPRSNQWSFRAVSFVMKDAKVWKRDGVAVGMI